MGKKDRSSFLENENNYDQEIEIPVSKDKKKKKPNITELDDVSFEEQDQSHSQENQLNNNSSKKRKSQKLLKKSLENYEQHDNLKTLETSEWSKEESKELLDIIKNMCKPTQKRSYRVALNKLDFDKVANQLESNKTSDNCRHHLQSLISKTIKVKSLHQVITETIQIIIENVVNRKSAIDLFWEEKKDLIRSVAQQDKKPNILTTRFLLWTKLPEEERLYYQGQVEKPKNPVRRKQVQEGKFDDPVKSPFRIFLEKRRKKYPSSPFAETRVKYTKMDSSKKIKFIKKSFETLYLEKEALLKYSELYPDKPPPKKNSSHYPSHEEIKCYYHQHLELPEVPPKSRAIFAMNANDLVSNNLIEATVKFNKLDKKEQQEWQIKFRKMWSNYFEQLTDWIARQDPRDLELMDKWPFLKCEKNPGDMNKKTNSVKNLKTAEKKAMKTVEKVFKEVVMPINIKKFNNEPLLPALSLMGVYEDFIKKHGEQYEKSDLMHKFHSLSESERAHIQEKTTFGRNKYIKDIKKYVNGLTDEMRKLYLGLRRKKLMNALEEDIFEEIYPDEQYPVYVNKLINSKIDECEQKKDISSPTKKGRRNLLPLENDLLDIVPLHQSSSKSKKVNTVKASVSDSKELTTDSSFESSPRKLKKRKMSLSPQKSKKKKTSKSSSSDSEEVTNDSHAESSLKAKKTFDSSTVSTKSPKKSIMTPFESSSDSENEVKSKLTPEKPHQIENSSSEEEDISEAWHSNYSLNKSN